MVNKQDIIFRYLLNCHLNYIINLPYKTITIFAFVIFTFFLYWRFLYWRLLESPMCCVSKPDQFRWTFNSCFLNIWSDILMTISSFFMQVILFTVTKLLYLWLYIAKNDKIWNNSIGMLCIVNSCLDSHCEWFCILKFHCHSFRRRFWMPSSARDSCIIRQ